MGWLLHVLGVDNVSGRWYGFWSGFGSDVGEVAIVGGLITIVRRHTCHIHRLLAHRPSSCAGQHRVVCRMHHPEDPPSHGDVLAHAERQKES